MKIEKMNFYSPKKYKWKGIKITEQAIEQILFLINKNPKNKGIRIGTKKSGCAGFRYTMELVKNNTIEKENKNDIVFYYNNILVYISLKEAPFLNGIKIDFVKDSINEVFKYCNPRIKTFCGCGESFSID
ncbi:iron-sulfur cluster assembly accessory protein [Buchnera aphidicola]|jgi:Fe-S cluster assembly protein SufA|uniref:Uncharacterized protein BUsg_114 n=1 Tax=Buchnera aphidicola subsp. Schizaphis graminum (strain Sg) TaxID=198804 RepID=Y114_BUCAP|nr:iron-sulfur cluster assembly accessory protein [Buchnera aphidicola]Q8KA13.1 RecName: Full=Uncharacterized protein BUsg_114 [Buchnera aphidicola str. Sg (Schizaphis graminum)]AAM67683.1 hypothetical 13.3 kDa protein [Buchnera aphidicola str. Sg (Schizaphis graminum)]AWI49820.1 iron-sulfur cluster assembly accessory protein [Buchnera aphidicola (Schizaphis graminum)]